MAPKKIVAVTNCPAGIAHTYMVAEAFERKAKELGYEIHVETQGASGVENALSPDQIAAADYVILAVGRGISDSDKARFDGKKIIDVNISTALKDVADIFDHLEEKSSVYHSSTASPVNLGTTKNSGQIMNHLMAGISAALPFIIGGGILVAIANIMVCLIMDLKMG